MNIREPAKDGVSTPGDLDEHTPAVTRIGFATHEPLVGKPVDETHGAVMADVQTLGQCADRRRCVWRQPLQREQQLVLLRIEPARAGRFLTEGEKPADLVAEFGERAIVSGTRLAHVKYRSTI